MIKDKLSGLGVSAKTISMYGFLVDCFRTNDEKAGASFEEALCSTVNTVVSEKGADFAKKYFELQAKRLDSSLSGKVDDHKKSVSDLLALFEGSEQEKKV